jgi:putative SOS response-associated peptidase YedK
MGHETMSATGDAMFGRREKDPTKVLRLARHHWRQGELLRVSPRPRWNADPGAKRLVVRRHELGELALAPMRWGLMPEWQREDAKARPLIVVRAETIAEQIEWRRLLNAKRCAVPADQFFEWARSGGVKTKEYVFKLRSRKPMMIAALWDRAPAASGRTVESFTYISCPANELVDLIHDRMPVILDEAAVATWFNPDATLESLLALLQPIDSMKLDLYPVRVPNGCVRPYQPSLFAPRAA